MKIVSWNVNGLRAAERHGFISAYKNIGADIFCLQEIKANRDQLSDEISGLSSLVINSAEKKGYSGTAMYSNRSVKTTNREIGFSQFDTEGRVLELDFGKFILLNLYMPHGGRQKEKLSYKINCYKSLFKYVKKIKKESILIGDFNIAHSEIDLERPRNNQNNIMFTKEERGLIDKLESLGYVDTFREFNDNGGNYTWWPYMANARERNLGWRIDYCFVSKGLEDKLKSAFILPNVMGSDHCPIGIDLDL